MMERRPFFTAEVWGREFLQGILTPCNHGLHITDKAGRTARLRRAHDGMSVSVFDGKGPLLNEVFSVRIGGSESHRDGFDDDD